MFFDGVLCWFFVEYGSWFFLFCFVFTFSCVQDIGFDDGFKGGFSGGVRGNNLLDIHWHC